MKSSVSIERFRKKQAHQATMRDAEAIVNECVAKRAKYYDITMLYTLHTIFGFGKERCRRFYLGMIKNYLGMLNQFQSDGDDSHFWVMESRLKADGIDVSEIVREGDELAKEYDNGNT